MCQICMKKLFDTVRQFNSQELEVHHIVPLADDYDLRLENENLITLCVRHHKMADAGIIPEPLLLEIARENEENGCQVVADIPP
ncbi:HNH endonuclease [Anaerotignum lactatifermentans]|uniref:HNH endonuclease n=1 Tax=Anaerotignum lactatifermentans TaxID=160404 RepID=UPI001FAECF0C|nr:HNH endonuclease [Anaerotignum lactatifermentans]